MREKHNQRVLALTIANPNPDPDPVPDPTPNPKPNLDPHPHPHQVKMLFSATLTRNPSKLAPLQLYASQAFEPRTSRQA
jgi:hypothetical protein